jgi:hypothetical protein
MHIKYSCNTCEGWHKPSGHPVEDSSVKYRQNVDLYLCDDCYEAYTKEQRK